MNGVDLNARLQAAAPTVFEQKVGVAGDLRRAPNDERFAGELTELDGALFGEAVASGHGDMQAVVTENGAVQPGSRCHRPA